MDENYNSVTIEIHISQGDEDHLDLQIDLDHPDQINGEQVRDEILSMMLKWSETWVRGGASVGFHQ